MATGASCGQYVPSFSGFGRGVADGPDVGAVEESQVGLHANPAPGAGRGHQVVGQRVAGRDTGRPDDDRALDLLAVAETDRVLLDGHDRSTELDVDAGRFESSLGVGAGALGKSRQQSRRHVDQHDADPRGVQSQTVALDGDGDELGERARRLDAGRSAPDDHERELRRPGVALAADLGLF